MIHITSHIHPLSMIITYHKWIRMMIIHCSQSSQYISQKEQFNGCQKYWFGHQMGTVNFRSCHFLPHFLPYQTEPTHSPNSIFVISRAPFPMKLTTGSRTWLPWQKVYTLIYEGWTLTRDQGKRPLRRRAKSFNFKRSARTLIVLLAFLKECRNFD